MKMKAVGVIVEYNPFHNGHLYHLQQAREQTQADVVIAVMSGNFLQRGEPAIVDKWARATMALAGGADLVVELPVLFSVQPADYFAKGGISLLQGLKCEAICFGTESGTAEDYELFAKRWHANNKHLQQVFQEEKNDGSTYAAQMSHVIEKITADLTIDVHSPNTILGLAYAKENARYLEPMQLVPIQRRGAQYHDHTIASGSFASATAIRKALRNKKSELSELEEVLPLSSIRELEQHVEVDWQSFWPLLKYQILVQSPEQLREIYQMTEGIEYRLKQKVLNADSFSAFVSEVKTKRFSWVRLQRLCVYILLQLKENEVKKALSEPSVAHLLGFNKRGQAYLSEKKKSFSVPLLTRIHQKNNELWYSDIKAGRIYALANEKIREQDFGRVPIQK